MDITWTVTDEGIKASFTVDLPDLGEHELCYPWHDLAGNIAGTVWNKDEEIKNLKQQITEINARYYDMIEAVGKGKKLEKKEKVHKWGSG